MSRKEQRRLEAANQKQEAEGAPKKVFMRFEENKFYNDQEKPIFEAGKVYELEGADWIQRWVKRGGEIVTPEKAVEEKAFSSKMPESADQGDGTVKLGDSEPKEKTEELKSSGAEGEIRTTDGGNEESSEE